MIQEATVSMDTFLEKLSRTKGASDLLITVGRPPQTGLNNEIVALDYPVLTQEDCKSLCLSILSADQAKRFREEKEIDLSLSLPGVGRFRVNMFQQRGSYAVVIRAGSDRIPDLISICPITCACWPTSAAG